LLVGAEERARSVRVFSPVATGEKHPNRERRLSFAAGGYGWKVRR
jgi:hypothetical protein